MPCNATAILHPQYPKKDKAAQTDMGGAALLTEDGREIPIEEGMILAACAACERLWHYPTQIQLARRQTT